MFFKAQLLRMLSQTQSSHAQKQAAANGASQLQAHYDVVLVGSGIMSATLGALLKSLDASLNILIVERLPNVAAESTDAWNNAGTGHAGYCELNYTPENNQGVVETNRALAINASFEVSLQFWAHLVEQQILPAPTQFMNATPHLSVVWGKDNVAYLRKRHAALSQHPLFANMEYSEDPSVLSCWMPLVMQGRDLTEPIAATRIQHGSDIDFGALTRYLIQYLTDFDRHIPATLACNTQLKTLKQSADGQWQLTLIDKLTKTKKIVSTKFVFLGAGGGALKLLQASKIPEAQGYGGFPVSGQWLVCNNPEVVAQHTSKVYGKAAIGAPPMSVPHLDTRIINGQTALLFGPYAGFTTKFLKQGSYLDLLKSLKPNNIKPILNVGKNNMDLTRYLIGESVQRHKQRMESLKQYYPMAQPKDWQLKNAGKRVQIIKQCDEKGGKLEFGTEIVAAKDGSIAALLGASPGASVSVTAMIEVIEACFATQLNIGDWALKLKTLIPSYGESLIENTALLEKVRKRTLRTLKLD